jgi:polyphenol oxidase
MDKNAFILREAEGIPYYSCRAFEELPLLRHGFSTRHGGKPRSSQNSFNLGYTEWDSSKRVDENRNRFLSALNLPGMPLATLHQVHSNRVHIIKDIPGQWNQADGDALVTKVEGIALAIQIADCLPVLIADPVKNVLAAVHSGWRGTLGKIFIETVREMENVFGSEPGRLLAAIGPGIRACCFEVGLEVASLFDKEFPGCALAKPINTRPGKFLLDLPRALEIQFQAAGIRPEKSFDLGKCNRCNTNEFFSYRAEGSNSGRMMAVIAYHRD